MRMEANTRFVLVDDDAINNMLSELTIAKIFPDAEVKAFTDPELGIDYLLSDFENSNMAKTFLFLDINMPAMTGWEFIEQLEVAGTTVKEQLCIYVLSSSINPVDLEKAKRNDHVIDFIEKPLTFNFLSSLV